ncbi:hypothetical protein EOL96_04975 [Candidatus Saccharibacteria bacterium]|nr:hypothetical protein [Candidatus Saccharibacteria bacterium]
MATTISNTQTKDKLMLSPDRGERSLVSGEDFRRFASLIGEYYHSDSLDDSQIHSVMEYSYSLTDSIANGFGGHPFTINSQYTDELELIADGHIKKDGTLSAKSQDANRLFALGVYAYIEQHVHVDDSENATLKRLEEGYFSTSPNIISYVGGIGEQISVLAFAERSKAGRRLSSNTRGEIIYTGCLYDDYEDGLVAELKRGYDNQRSLPARISYINTVERLSNEAIGDGEWTEPFTLGGRELCGLVRDDETQHPLVRIMADQYEYSIAATYASEYIFYDDYEPSYQELAETDAQRRSETVAEQGTIHDKYPRASQSLYLEQVASNAAIGLDGGIVDTLFLDSGREINIAAPDELSVEDATLVSVLYKPSVRAEVEEQLGLSLGQLKFEEQHQLLRYMANTDELSYKRLCTRLSQMEKQERVEFAKVF